MLPGDRVALLGRDAATINTGGEKVFAEEVEEAVKAHPGVTDAVVCGRPSEKWGSEVVAIVHRRPEAAVHDGSLVEFCRSRIASYKLPKAIVFVEQVRRSPSGNADYTWALSVATADRLAIPVVKD